MVSTNNQNMMSPRLRFRWENTGNHTEMDTNRAVTNSLKIQDTRDFCFKEQQFYFSVLQESDGLQYVSLAILHLVAILRYKSRQQRETKIKIPAFICLHSLSLSFSHTQSFNWGEIHILADTLAPTQKQWTPSWHVNNTPHDQLSSNKPLMKSQKLCLGGHTHTHTQMK